MELLTGAFSWWKCHWPDMKSAGLFRRNLLTLSLWPINCRALTSSHTSHHPSQTPCLPWISYATQKLMLNSCKMLQKHSDAFHTFLWHFFQVLNRILLHIVLLSVFIAFCKFTSCDNQTLVGYIPIPAEAVHLNLKS